MKEFDQVYALYKSAMAAEKKRHYALAFKDMKLAFESLLDEYQAFIKTKFAELTK